MQVFIPGAREIEDIQDNLIKIMPADLYSKTAVRVLHSMSPTEEQDEALTVASQLPGCPYKVILSTNIAETSLTIPDIKYIVDTGLRRDVDFDNDMGVSVLATRWISKASATQRKGRAGRVAPGVCIRLYTVDFYKKMHDYDTPEALIMPLESVALRTKQFLSWQGLVPSIIAQLPDAPEPAAVDKAIQRLIQSGAALDVPDGDFDITQMGRLATVLTDIGSQLVLARLVIIGISLGLVADAIILAACATVHDVFVHSSRMFAQSSTDYITTSRNALVSRLAHDDGALSDHITARNAFITWHGYEQYSSSLCVSRMKAVDHVVTRLSHTIRDMALQCDNTSLRNVVYTSLDSLCRSDKRDDLNFVRLKNFDDEYHAHPGDVVVCDDQLLLQYMIAAAASDTYLAHTKCNKDDKTSNTVVLKSGDVDLTSPDMLSNVLQQIGCSVDKIKTDKNKIKITWSPDEPHNSTGAHTNNILLKLITNKGHIYLPRTDGDIDKPDHKASVELHSRSLTWLQAPELSCTFNQRSHLILVNNNSSDMYVVCPSVSLYSLGNNKQIASLQYSTILSSNNDAAEIMLMSLVQGRVCDMEPVEVDGAYVLNKKFVTPKIEAIVSECGDWLFGFHVGQDKYILEEPVVLEDWLNDVRPLRAALSRLFTVDAIVTCGSLYPAVTQYLQHAIIPRQWPADDNINGKVVPVLYCDSADYYPEFQINVDADEQGDSEFEYQEQEQDVCVYEEPEY